MPFIYFDCVAREEGPLGLSLRPLLPGETSFLCTPAESLICARLALTLSHSKHLHSLTLHIIRQPAHSTHSLDR